MRRSWECALGRDRTGITWVVGWWWWWWCGFPCIYGRGGWCMKESTAVVLVTVWSVKQKCPPVRPPACQLAQGYYAIIRWILSNCRRTTRDKLIVDLVASVWPSHARCRVRSDEQYIASSALHGASPYVMLRPESLRASFLPPCRPYAENVGTALTYEVRGGRRNRAADSPADRPHSAGPMTSRLSQRQNGAATHMPVITPPFPSEGWVRS